METEKEYFAEERKNGEGKGGKYLEKEKISFAEEKKRRRRKKRKIFGEGKNVLCGGEEERRRKISWRLSIGEGKIIVDGWTDGRVEGSRRSPRGSKKVTWKG